MNLRVWTIGVLGIFAFVWLGAQPMEAKVQPRQGETGPGVYFSNPDIDFSVSTLPSSAKRMPENNMASPPALSLNSIQPKYVRENPTGYSYLCRLELQIEEKLPVGIWINLGEYSHLPGNGGGNAHLKFKLINF